MFDQPSFLLQPDVEKRQYLQWLGFMSHTTLDIAAELIGKETFVFPTLHLQAKEVAAMKIPKYLRLGNRLEQFFSFLITMSEGYEVVVENIQIIENRVTLGELDFLVREKESHLIYHIELAAKLYLYNPKIEGELGKWIGPNLKDSLLGKLKKLQEVQFPMLYHPQTQNTLSIIGIQTSEIVQKLAFKTRLFLPLSMKGIVPPFVSSHNIKGYYIDYESFTLDVFAKNLYFLPEKQDWIVDPKYCEVWFDHTYILAQIKKINTQKQSPLVWMKTKEGTYESLFVVFWEIVL